MDKIMNKNVEAYRRLEDICRENLSRKYGNKTNEAEARLSAELECINRNGNAQVYLFYYDLIQKCGLHPVQYDLRGAAAGMIVCYLLGISHVDPLDSEVPLYSEFLIGVNGNSSPDIDINVDAGVWQEVLESAGTMPGIHKTDRKGRFEMEDGVRLDILPSDYCAVNSRLYEATGYYPTDEDIRSDVVMKLVTNCKGLGITPEENNGTKAGLLGIPCFMNDFALNLVDILQPKNMAELVRLDGIFHGTGTWLHNGEILFEEERATLDNMVGCREDVYEMLMSHMSSSEESRMTAYSETVAVSRGSLHRDDNLSKMKRKLWKHRNIPEWFIWSCERMDYLFHRAKSAEYVQTGLRSLYYKLNYPEVYYPVFFRVCGNETMKHFLAKGNEGYRDMKHYLDADRAATIEDLYLFRTWTEYRLRVGGSLGER